MRFALVLPAPAQSNWHRAAVEAIAAVPGLTVEVAVRPVEPLPAAVQLLLRLERIVRRVGPDLPTEPAPAPPPRAPAAGPADVILDLSGEVPPPGGPGSPARLTLTCGGRRLDLGAVDAIFAGATPVLALDHHGIEGPRPLARWATSVENRAVLTFGLANVLGRAVQLAAAAAAAIAAGAEPSSLSLGVCEPESAADAGGVASFAAASVATTARHRLEALLRTAPRWFVGVRDDGGETGLPDFTRGPFRAIPDGGTRFFADPFPASRDGRRAILVEEYPFATQKGVISAIDVGEDGRFSAPRVIIEEDCHLSYPYLLEEDGVLYMVPETSGRGTVELWRSVAFPDRWEKVAVLIEGRDLSDATIVREGDGWIMFAASRGRWCSSWDALDLWRAPALTGPWTRIGDAPVMVDPRVARPAGTPIRVGGRLIRPVQDCSVTYGGALAFAAVDRIGAIYRQTVVARSDPAPRFAGMHSWARGGGLEVVDIYGRSEQETFLAATDKTEGRPQK